jgi:hypothetical protein
MTSAILLVTSMRKKSPKSSRARVKLTVQLEQVQTTDPRIQTVHLTVHTSSINSIATSCMRQLQQDTAASPTALVCLHASCPAGNIPAVSAGSEVLVTFTSRNQRDHAR